MNKEIKLIIEKSLPAQVGTVLKEALTKAESDAAELEACKKTLENVREMNRSIEARLKTHIELDLRIVAIDVREKAVEKKEVRQEVDHLRIQLEESEKRADAVTSFTTGLVRNTVFRKTIFGSDNQAGYSDDNGNWVQPTPVNKDLTETKEKE